MKKILTVLAGLLVVWGWLVVAAPAFAHDHHWVEQERAQINREREAMHRRFDAMMRNLDAEGREIDRWQSRQRHGDHQAIAHIANQKRDALNRERDRLNRERDRMNRYYDEQNRALDHRHQQQPRRRDYGYHRHGRQH
ncbi:MAG: hypothetical protein WA987_07455 [Cellvibrio sp.]|jgi:hypothetical protein